MSKRRFAVRLAAMVCVAIELARPAIAARAPMGARELEAEADLIVVGRVKEVVVENEQSRIEKTAGNRDWAVYLTVEVDSVEKGFFADRRLTLRCFRPRSRRSLFETISPQGNYPIPGKGALIRAYLRGTTGNWTAIVPNGIAAADRAVSLGDSAEVRLLGAGHFTYGLPLELWMVLAAATALVAAGLFLVRRLRRRAAGAARGTGYGSSQSA